MIGWELPCTCIATSWSRRQRSNYDVLGDYIQGRFGRIFDMQAQYKCNDEYVNLKRKVKKTGKIRRQESLPGALLFVNFQGIERKGACAEVPKKIASVSQLSWFVTIWTCLSCAGSSNLSSWKPKNRLSCIVDVTTASVLEIEGPGISSVVLN